MLSKSYFHLQTKAPSSVLLISNVYTETSEMSEMVINNGPAALAALSSVVSRQTIERSLNPLLFGATSHTDFTHLQVQMMLGGPLLLTEQHYIDMVL